jgi:meso-butanediol dehydrogenase / (S,S)-butanediol dehydrogenase / diacetyl reductase
MGRLDGKIALVTGVAGGIGRAAAVLFATEGARVVGCDLKLDETAETVRLAQAAAAEAGSGGDMVGMGGVDLGDEASARAWVEAAAASYDGVDIVYNNAGAFRIGHIDNLDAADYRFTMRMEVDSAFYVTSAAWPHLVARGGGSIVNMASMAAIRGARFVPMVAHGAGKGALLSATYHFAAAGAGLGIRANAILPGLIRTPGTEADGVYANPDSPGFLMGAANPMGRTGEPMDIAKVALFLASDDAFYVNGTSIIVDGGQNVVV